MVFSDSIVIHTNSAGRLEVVLDFYWDDSYSKATSGKPEDVAKRVEKKHNVCRLFTSGPAKIYLQDLAKADETYADATWLLADSIDFKEDDENIFGNTSNEDLGKKLLEMWKAWTAGGGSGIDTEPKRIGNKTPFYEKEEKYIKPRSIIVKIKGI